ncbi:MAG: hypothetical protein ACYCYK_05675 [Candidatus Dormibacteria bacterium]
MSSSHEGDDRRRRLVALAAMKHGAELATRDSRAWGAYIEVGVRATIAG